jgi:transposase
MEMNSEDEKELEKLIIEILTDLQRPGAPDKFTAEQVTQILALACEDPSLSERPIKSWTNRELADEAKLRGIVKTISRRTVGRFLKRRGNKTT